MKNAVQSESDRTLWVVIRETNKRDDLLRSDPAPVGYCATKEEAEAFIEAVKAQHREALATYPLKGFGDFVDTLFKRSAIVTLDPHGAGDHTRWYALPAPVLAALSPAK